MKKIGNYFFPDSDIHFQRWVLDGEYQKKQRDELFLKMNSIKPIKRICDIGGHVERGQCLWLNIKILK